MTVPQIGGMYRGDRARKMNLVEHGFRLPSALDNRPLNFEEWENALKQTVYVSATPGEYELSKTGGEVVEQVIRPTGLLDPVVEVRPAAHQVDDLLDRDPQARRKERARAGDDADQETGRGSDAITTRSKGIRVKYLHSDIETLERIEILRDLRLGTFDVLVGINLLSEGLDLPEVSLVAILDADKEGFLRSHRSLIQTIGRAARNFDGLVILYADRITEACARRSTRPRAARAAKQVQRGARHQPDDDPQGDPGADRAHLRRGSGEPIRLGQGGSWPSARSARARAPGTGSAHLQAAEAAPRSGGRGWRALDMLDEAEQLEQIREAAGDYFTRSAEIHKTIGKMDAEMKDAARAMQFERAADCATGSSGSSSCQSGL